MADLPESSPRVESAVARETAAAPQAAPCAVASGTCGVPQPHDRRYVLLSLLKLPCSLAAASVLGPELLGAAEEAGAAGEEKEGYDPAQHYYGMGIQVDRCIGCGRCVESCKTENDVPREPFFFRTWVERYTVYPDGETTVESPEGGIQGFKPDKTERGFLRSFFVPKLCNQCDHPPCVQVCPVGATFKSPDGVVLVDRDYCIGCRYCIQACPYGARFLDPRTMVADKCTFCYHRITKGLLPACVEVCPTQARIFGEIKSAASPLRRLMRTSTLNVLKPGLNTEPKVFYSELDNEVR